MVCVCVSGECIGNKVGHFPRCSSAATLNLPPWSTKQHVLYGLRYVTISSRAKLLDI